MREHTVQLLQGLHSVLTAFLDPRISTVQVNVGRTQAESRLTDRAWWCIELAGEAKESPTHRRWLASHLAGREASWPLSHGREPSG